ncbi:MAG: phenylalanine--tRNA ligase subunit beta [Metallosphaera sp.]
MPTININKWILKDLTGLNEQELEEYLFRLKSEVSALNEDEYSIEVNADRLDMLSLGGIVRALKGITEQELGEPRYIVKETDYSLEVGDVPSRPYALACVVYNVKLDPEVYLKELIQFQEKLHDTIGRKRKKVAIGIHDLEKVKSKRIQYRLVPYSAKFVPLGQDKEMSVDEVSRNTYQGKQYSQISMRDGYSPAIVDEEGILSLPPVINSERTRVTSRTKSLLLDVTGTNLDSVVQTMDLIATGLAELGAEIGIVKIEGIEIGRSPVLRHDTVYARLADIRERLGINLSGDQVVKLLRKMRMEAEVRGDSVVVNVPPYRVDIMNYTDIAEDVGMAYGYENFDLEKSRVYEIGHLFSITSLYRKLRISLVGAGFVEVYSLNLIKSSYQKGEYVKISNPISIEYDSIRNSLAWNSLLFLSRNQHSRFPVRIFEIGDVVRRDNAKDTGYTNETMLSVAIMDSRVSYEMLQAPIHQVLLNLTGTVPSYKAKDNDLFIRGRSAEIWLGYEKIGILGEINPSVLNEFGLVYPVLFSEISLNVLEEVMKP